MQDVHQLAGEARDAEELLCQADERFVNKRETAKTATSLTELDAMITQLLNYKDTFCRRMEVISASRQQEAQKPPKIITVRRDDLCSVKRLQSKEDIDICEDHRPEFSGWRYRSWLASFRCGGLVCTFFGYGSMPHSLRQFLNAYLRQPTGRPFCS